MLSGLSAIPAKPLFSPAYFAYRMKRIPGTESLVMLKMKNLPNNTDMRQSRIFSNALQLSMSLELDPPTVYLIFEAYKYCCVVPIAHNSDKDKVLNTL